MRDGEVAPLVPVDGDQLDREAQDLEAQIDNLEAQIAAESTSPTRRVHFASEEVGGAARAARAAQGAREKNAQRSIAPLPAILSNVEARMVDSTSDAPRVHVMPASPAEELRDAARAAPGAHEKNVQQRIAPLPALQKISTGSGELSPWERTRLIYRTGKLRSQGKVLAIGVDAMKKDSTRQMIRKVFDELDVDQSGYMNRAEFGAMIKSCSGKKRKSKEVDAIFEQLQTTDDRTGEISFEAFEAWFAEEMRRDVRAARILARQLFNLVDTDESGTLTKQEFSSIATRLKTKFPHLKLEPPFDLETDWRNMCLAAADTKGNIPQVIAWDNFERWWRQRAGDDEGMVPVLPEAMVNRLTDQNLAHTIEQIQDEHPGWSKSDCRWAYLKPRLIGLMQMEKIWGRIGDLYGSADSVYRDIDSLPPGIYSPESKFMNRWDLAQLTCIIYIAVAVPWRLGFDITISLDSFMFWWDVLVDMYFIADVVMNFRLAYFTQDGMLETNLHNIRYHYFRGWFLVDFVASIPFTWVATVYAQASDSQSSNQAQLRMIKTIRMLRLLKMLRVTRIMKILDRHAKYTDWSVAMSSAITLLTIMYGTHILACFWYMSGNSNELGWVHRLLSEPTPQCPVCPNIHPLNRYVHSMYTVLLMGDATAVSAAEKSYAIFAYCVIIVIQGALAGLMSQLMMSSRIGEQEYIIKLAQLKAWMKARQFSRQDSRRIMKHFTANNQSATYFDEKQILSFLPTGTSREISLLMYHDVLAHSPLFRLLGRELMLRLSEAVVPVSVIKAQTIFKAGDVGHEMFFVMRGEVEVMNMKNAKLGFIGHGGFFGERTVIEAVDRKFGSGSCMRVRTVVATADSDLAMLATDTILTICEHYPELEVRLKSFKRVGTTLGSKGKTAKAARLIRAASMGQAETENMIRTAADDELMGANAADSKFSADGEMDEDNAGQAEWMKVGRRLLKCSNGDLKLAIARLMDAHTQETQRMDLDKLMASVRDEHDSSF